MQLEGDKLKLTRKAFQSLIHDIDDMMELLLDPPDNLNLRKTHLPLDQEELGRMHAQATEIMYAIEFNLEAGR